MGLDVSDLAADQVFEDRRGKFGDLLRRQSLELVGSQALQLALVQRGQLSVGEGGHLVGGQGLQLALTQLAEGGGGEGSQLRGGEGCDLCLVQGGQLRGA